MMKSINLIGIVGAGTMGSALTQKFATEGLSVILVDRETKFIERGLENIRTTLKQGVERRLFDSAEMGNILNRIQTSTDLGRLVDCQMVIEAVFEDRQVKRDLFKQLSALVAPDTILATNTSSFSVTDIASDVKHARRFLGLHFFYHAAKNRLVEIVRGRATDEATFQTCLLFMQRCGKDPIICADSHGFAVNRFFVPWLNEAARLVEEGLADISGVDRIARKIFGCGMGPFDLMNATGIPIAYHSQHTLEQAFGSFYQPSELLKTQVDKNEPWIIKPGAQLSFETEKQIENRLLGVIFYVCGQLLDEKVCSAGDINRGAGIGLRWRNGPLELFHNLGSEKVLELVQNTASAGGHDLPRSLNIETWQPDYIKVEKSGETGIITINRPEGLNAINSRLLSQFSRGFDRLNSDSSLKTILITGRGKAFVAGADIKFFIDNIRQQTVSKIVDFTREGQALFKSIDESEKTIVALVNGLALGGGLELALAADIIIALEGAVFAFPETGIGIYPALGGTFRAVNRVGPGLSKYLIYSGQMLRAHKALSIGLIDGVITWDDYEKVLENPEVFKKNENPPDPLWKDTAEFFNGYSVEQILADDKIPQKWEKLVKRIRGKAPLALKISEKLINSHRGPESELEYLEEIFASDDALAGLESVGRNKPVYKGK